MALFQEQKKRMNPSTARIIAVVFFIVGIVFGAFDGPLFLTEILERFKIPSGFLTKTNSWFPYRLGLDIQGGTHLVYQADLLNISTSEYSASMDAVRDVIERRVNLFGVSEPVVQIEKSGSDWRLIVELAGIKDVNAAINLIGATPFLEFKEERSQEMREGILEGQKAGKIPPTEDPYFISSGLTGRFLKRAEVDFDQVSFKPQISLELTDEGAEIFGELTKRNIGKPLAIYLDGAPISAPVVQEEITGGRAQITGDFTPDEAKELVGRLNAGALPVPVTLISQQTVGASLGEESLQKIVQAGMYGFLAVALFMMFWYRLPGFISVFALMLYIAIVLAIFKLIPVTLTIAGIAGFILSVGMAVDANILIFERLKEELRKGHTMNDAVLEGFRRAWTSIRDSNVTSLITSSILYWLGVSVVKGFALTLGIGILISMFSAITVTRTLLIALLSRRLENIRFLFLSGLAGSEKNHD